MDKNQFKCECGHDADDHAEGFMGNGTHCRKCNCRRYRLSQPTELPADFSEMCAQIENITKEVASAFWVPPKYWQSR